MTKSDIVVSIFLTRVNPALNTQEAKTLLQSELEKSSKYLINWDEDVNTSIATAIISNLKSSKTEVSMEMLIEDVDLILKRIT